MAIITTVIAATKNDLLMWGSRGQFQRITSVILYLQS